MQQHRCAVALSYFLGKFSEDDSIFFHEAIRGQQQKSHSRAREAATNGTLFNFDDVQQTLYITECQ